MGHAWHEAAYRMYDQIGGGELGVPAEFAPPPEVPQVRGGTEMLWHNVLTVWSIGASSLGMVAELVTPVPTNVSWAFVVFAGIPAVTLGMRLGYWAWIRWLEHQERMATIARGRLPVVGEELEPGRSPPAT